MRSRRQPGPIPPAASGAAGAFSIGLKSAFERTGCRQIDADQVIYAEGDPARTVYRIEEGVARLCRLLANGRRSVLRFAFQGDLLGLEAGDDHACQAEAVTPVRLRTCPREQFDEAVMAATHEGGLIRLMASELEQARTLQLMLGQMRAVERLEAFLDAIRRRAGYDIDDLPMSRSDIADHLGLTTETVSRAFGEVRRRQVSETAPERVRASSSRNVTQRQAARRPRT